MRNFSKYSIKFFARRCISGFSRFAGISTLLLLIVTTVEAAEPTVNEACKFIANHMDSRPQFQEYRFKSISCETDGAITVTEINNSDIDISNGRQERVQSFNILDIGKFNVDETKNDYRSIDVDLYCAHGVKCMTLAFPRYPRDNPDRYSSVRLYVPSPQEGERVIKAFKHIQKIARKTTGKKSNKEAF